MERKTINSCIAAIFTLVLWTIEVRSQTEIHFAKTFNLLERIQPGVVPTYGLGIVGFKTVSLTDLVRRTYTSGPHPYFVGGARPEDPPCPFTPVFSLRYPSNIIYSVDWVCNVSGRDISEDDDCACETHIANIQLMPIWVYFVDGSVRYLNDHRIPGRFVLCPNIRDGHHIRGPLDFGGPVDTWITLTLRVADDSMSLLADIEYNIITSRL